MRLQSVVRCSLSARIPLHGPLESTQEREIMLAPRQVSIQSGGVCPIWIRGTSRDTGRLFTDIVTRVAMRRGGKNCSHRVVSLPT